MARIDCGWIGRLDVMPNLAAIPTGTSSMWDKSTLNCVASDISQTNGQPFHMQIIHWIIYQRMKSWFNTGNILSVEFYINDMWNHWFRSEVNQTLSIA
jgi:hypothetical protein